MRKREFIIPVLAAACFVGCSKSPSAQPQVTTPANPAEAATFMTNSLDVLQAQYQQDEKQIEEVQSKLDALRRKYGITDTSPTQLDQTNHNGEAVVTSQQPYWDAKRKLTEMLSFQRQLAVKIEADKIDQQLKRQAGSH